MCINELYEQMVTYFEGIPIAQVLCGSRHVMAIPQVQINSMREDNDRVVLYAWGWGEHFSTKFPVLLYQSISNHLMSTLIVY